VGRYEIDAELGRGAMGAVYRARDPKIDRTVAIKTVCLAGVESDAEEEYRRRFAVEARAAGRLSHSGIVTIFDVGEEAETRMPYLVMEYVEGRSLENVLSEERKQLPVNTSLRLAQELAEALHYAHEQGVVHRDIKPANILITRNGHAKIADFGIAKLNQAQLTVAGEVLGTPAYMAPEQLKDEVVDGRSDLFSLGVILYFALTGHRPFQGNSATTVCFKVVSHEPLAVSSFDPKLPPEIDRIVSRAMAKDRNQRYQTGMEMASDIRKLRESYELTQQSERTEPMGNASSGSLRDLPRCSGDLQLKPTDVPIRFGGMERENGLMPKWKGVILGVAFVIVIAFISLSALHGTHQQLGQVVKVEPEVESMTASSGTDNWGNNGKWSSSIVPDVPANTTLQIEIHHHFTKAKALVWLDDHLIYTHLLYGDTKIRALVFRRVEGSQFETIRVPAGKHRLRVRIQSPADHYDQSQTIADAAMRNGRSTLQIICGKQREVLQLKLQ
jgi:serine/threonine protein kinase